LVLCHSQMTDPALLLLSRAASDLIDLDWQTGRVEARPSARSD